MMDFLFKINQKLYNWPAHLIIFTAWVSFLMSGSNKIISSWIVIGLSFYMALWIYQIIRNPNYLKNALKDDNYLAFLVGLNIAVVLGILAIPLAIFLNKKD